MFSRLMKCSYFVHSTLACHSLGCLVSWQWCAASHPIKAATERTVRMKTNIHRMFSLIFDLRLQIFSTYSDLASLKIDYWNSRKILSTIYYQLPLKTPHKMFATSFCLFNKGRYFSWYVVIIHQALLDTAEKNSLQISAQRTNSNNTLL